MKIGVLCHEQTTFFSFLHTAIMLSFCPKGKLQNCFLIGQLQVSRDIRAPYAEEVQPSETFILITCASSITTSVSGEGEELGLNPPPPSHAADHPKNENTNKKERKRKKHECSIGTVEFQEEKSNCTLTAHLIYY